MSVLTPCSTLFTSLTPPPSFSPPSLLHYTTFSLSFPFILPLLLSTTYSDTANFYLWDSLLSASVPRQKKTPLVCNYDNCSHGFDGIGFQILLFLSFLRFLCSLSRGLLNTMDPRPLIEFVLVMCQCSSSPSM